MYDDYPAFTRKASGQSFFYKTEYEKWYYAHKFERWVIGPTIGEENVSFDFASWIYSCLSLVYGLLILCLGVKSANVLFAVSCNSSFFSNSNITEQGELYCTCVINLQNNKVGLNTVW